MNIDFKDEYLTKHLITYIGNKRKLLPFINESIVEIKEKINKKDLCLFDGFSGSGCVARLFKYHANTLHVNDLETYSRTVNQSYLTNKSEINLKNIKEAIDHLNSERHKEREEEDKGFIEKNYAPSDDNNIQEGERVFYTRTNARIIDNIRRAIKNEGGKELKIFGLAELIIEASIHNNTSGVFKGFHKKGTKGHFGGKGENALTRIKGEIKLGYPIFSPNECNTYIHQEDTNELVKELDEVDIAYYDPPYNQHPYGSNYFMLNIISNYDNPEIQEGVSGIIKTWNKSDYNKSKEAKEAMDDLIKNTKAKYTIISYNNEGIISNIEMRTILEKYGKVEIKHKEYNTYRGAKNTGMGKKLLDGTERPLKVEEVLWILKK